MTQEVLEAGPRAHPRRRGGVPAAVVWVLGLVALVALTAVSVAAIGDFAARTVENEQLISAVEGSESAMKATQDEFNAVLDEYDVQDMTDAQRAELLDKLAKVAAQGEAAIGAAGDQVGLVPVLPWHTNITAAQDAYLAHNAAWVAYMRASAQDPAEWFRPQPAVNETFAAAKLPLVSAIPWLDATALLPRVEAIFVDDGADGDSNSNTPGQPA